VAAIALAPPSVLNLMKAEINRLMLLTSEGVIEARVEVPRRQYIDFHSDLFPPVASKGACKGRDDRDPASC
jgi:coronin-7